jgi:PPP family 3-phenylpropionic acid transporter
VGRERQGLARGYFWYFATVGLFVPYWPPFLASRGLDPVEIGLVMGLFAAMRAIGPPAWAHWADATGMRLGVLRAAALLSAGLAASFHWLHSPWSIALVLAAYSAAWNGVMSIYDAHVLDRLGPEQERYGRLRLWGSVGFILFAVAGGPVLERAGMQWLPWALAAIVLATWWSLRGVPDAPPVEPRQGVGIGRRLADRRVLAFLLAVFLMVASHGPYYNFFTLYLDAAGYSRTAIGLLWAWAVVAEIGVFIAAPALLRRVPLRWLTVAALLATALRWALLGTWPGRAGLVFGAQALHLASFGLFHLCSVMIAGQLFPGRTAARGQALHGAVGYGLGGVAGAVGGGWLWSEVSPAGAFLAAAALAAAAAGVAAWGLRGLTDPRPGCKIREPVPDFGK